jgi:Cyclopropane fatty acid synthase and related methyltransferases
MNKTLNYYNENAKEYFDKTVTVSMSEKYDSFLKRLSKGSLILDLGCGSGRDSLYFIKNGYKVTAVEGSSELSTLASDYIGQPVQNIDFVDIKDVDVYDGIWACASLLHLEKSVFSEMLLKLREALKSDGVMYISLKIGKDFATYEGDRFFTYYTKETLYQLLKEANLDIIDEYTTSDGLNRDIEWINLIVNK